MEGIMGWFVALSVELLKIEQQNQQYSYRPCGDAIIALNSIDELQVFHVLADDLEQNWGPKNFLQSFLYHIPQAFNYQESAGCRYHCFSDSATVSPFQPLFDWSSSNRSDSRLMTLGSRVLGNIVSIERS